MWPPPPGTSQRDCKTGSSVIGTGKTTMKAKTMRRSYLAEATLGLAAARLAVRLLPAAWVFAWARRPPRRIQRFRSNEIEWVAWAVETVGAGRRSTALCLPRALAAQAMLRRRGIASRICLGVVRENDAVTAHAWVEIGRQMIVGGAAAGGFTKIAEFGGEPA